MRNVPHQQSQRHLNFVANSGADANHDATHPMQPTPGPFHVGLSLRNSFQSSERRAHSLYELQSLPGGQRLRPSHASPNCIRQQGESVTGPSPGKLLTLSFKRLEDPLPAEYGAASPDFNRGRRDYMRQQPGPQGGASLGGQEDAIGSPPDVRLACAAGALSSFSSSPPPQSGQATFSPLRTRASNS